MGVFLGNAVLVLLLISSLLVFIAGLETVTVSTRVGTFVGQRTPVPTLEGTADTFLGMRYAQPAQRFKLPEEIPRAGWAQSDPIDATTSKPVCVQGVTNFFNTELLPNQSEDCLFLNIYVPTATTVRKNLAVLVWVHGGSFTSGAATSFDPTVLSALGQVIVVTLNYRVGPLGWMTTLTGEIPGNLGMWDVLTALKWIRANIRGFGGDRNRVTVMGHSAGAILVNYLVSSPEVASSRRSQLFHRVILQSGAMGPIATVRDPLPTFTAISSSLGCGNRTTTEQVECMRGLDISAFQTNFGSPNFAPVVDGKLLTETPQEFLSMVSSGTLDRKRRLFISRLQAISGFQSQEALLFFAFGPQFIDLDVVRELVLLPSLTEDPQAANQVRAVIDDYISGLFNITDPLQRIIAGIQQGSEAVFVAPQLTMNNALTTLGSAVYAYEFDFPFQSRASPIIPSRLLDPAVILGSAHGELLPFVFGSTRADNLQFGGFVNATSSEQDLSNELIAYWTTFAKTGNPNKPELSPWTVYNSEDRNFLVLGENTTLQHGLFGDVDNIWNVAVEQFRTVNELTPLPTARAQGRCVSSGVTFTPIVYTECARFRRGRWAIARTCPEGTAFDVDQCRCADTAEVQFCGPNFRRFDLTLHERFVQSRRVGWRRGGW